MNVGSLGDVIFTVSDSAAHVISDFNTKISATYSVHKLHNRTAQLEFTGRDPEEIRFTILLSVYLGVAPETAYETLKSYLENGSALSLILGTRIIGEKWVITDIARAVARYDPDGDISEESLTITIKEYAA